MRKPGVIVAITVMAVMVVSCGGSDTAATTTTVAEPTTTAPPTTTTIPVPTVNGAIVLREFSTSEPCFGRGGFDDMRGGANVVVRDGNENVIGTGTLESGVLVDTGSGRGNHYCEFGFSVELARTADFYTVEVAGRGGPVYSHADMEENGWEVNLTLG